MVNTNNLNQCWADLLIEELVRNGAGYFCVSPGSRSSPLAVAVARNNKAKSFIHFDERGSAFHALGFTSADHKPCAIITTSGTAAANLFPAIIEASKKKAPLIVLTADRPPELRSTGAHQTIDQVKLFGEYVRMFVDLPTPTRAVSPEFILTTVDQAVQRSKGELGGPVHINCMFREPLEPVTTGHSLKNYLRPIKEWLKTDAEFTKYIRPKQKFDIADLTMVAEKINKAKQGIIVVGKLTNEQESRSVVAISKKLNWPIFADITSRLRFGAETDHVIHYFDQLLLSLRLKKTLAPDCVLHIGGRITSKRWYQFVEQFKPEEYIMVINHPLRNDPLHNVSVRVQSKVDAFLKVLTKEIKSKRILETTKKMIKCNSAVDKALEEHAHIKGNIDECQVGRVLTQQIKRDHALFLASSLSIRLIDMFGDYKARNIPIGSNRGASGIDGTIASACGFSTCLNKSTTLFIGDLAFLYDLNSLAMVKQLKEPMTIIVLNNNGGGIFSYLPISQYRDVFKKYFTTPHDLEFSCVADTFHLNYFRPGSIKEFKTAYFSALKKGGTSIIEVQTNQARNLDAIKQLQSKIVRIINKII